MNADSQHCQEGYGRPLAHVRACNHLFYQSLLTAFTLGDGVMPNPLLKPGIRGRVATMNNPLPSLGSTPPLDLPELIDLP